MGLSETELVRWGRRIGEFVAPPLVLALTGDLGAGKSVLARAVGEGAGVEGAMPSPTYNLVFRHAGAGGRHVAHLDLYRLSSPEEVWELGWSELGSEDEIVLIEWPDRAADLLPEDRWEIRLEVPAQAPLLRTVEVRRHGAPPDLPPLPVPVEAGSG